jgi:hypothetical protein
VSKHRHLPSSVSLAEPQPADFCCVPIGGSLGLSIEVGQLLAGDKFQPYDHAEIYIGEPDEAGPHGYTCSAYPHPDNARHGGTGRRALPCPPADLPGALWSSGILWLTPAERELILYWCREHQTVGYSGLDYGALALHALHVPAPGLREFIASTRSMICSQYVDAAYNYGGEHLFTNGRWAGYVKPGDLAGMLQSRITAQ